MKPLVFILVLLGVLLGVAVLYGLVEWGVSSLTGGKCVGCVECHSDEECETPMDYLVRSSCPFGSACIDGACEVVCPDWMHDPDFTQNRSVPRMCAFNKDCACEHHKGADVDRCVCHEGVCTAVMQRS